MRSVLDIQMPNRRTSDTAPYASAKFQEQFRYAKELKNIDIAFLGRGFIWKSNCKGIALVKDYINAKHIVLMHIQHDEYGEYNEVAAQLKNEFASIKIFRNKMETENYILE